MTTCPSCRAAVRFDAEWCTLCFAVLRAPDPAPAPEPLPEPPAVELFTALAQPTPGDVSPVGDPLTAPLGELVPDARAPEPAHAGPAGEAPEPTWPCTACGTANPLAASRCGACGTAFLGSASSTPSLVVPGLGDLGALSRGQRALAAVVAALALVVPVALLTLLLTGDAAGPDAPVEVTPVTQGANP